MQFLGFPSILFQTSLPESLALMILFIGLGIFLVFACIFLLWWARKKTPASPPPPPPPPLPPPPPPPQPDKGQIIAFLRSYRLMKNQFLYFFPQPGNPPTSYLIYIHFWTPENVSNFPCIQSLSLGRSNAYADIGFNLQHLRISRIIGLIEVSTQRKFTIRSCPCKLGSMYINARQIQESPEEIIFDGKNHARLGIQGGNDRVELELYTTTLPIPDQYFSKILWIANEGTQENPHHQIDIIIPVSPSMFAPANAPNQQAQEIPIPVCQSLGMLYNHMQFVLRYQNYYMLLLQPKAANIHLSIDNIPIHANTFYEIKSGMTVSLK